MTVDWKKLRELHAKASIPQETMWETAMARIEFTDATHRALPELFELLDELIAARKVISVMIDYADEGKRADLYAFNEALIAFNEKFNSRSVKR